MKSLQQTINESKESILIVDLDIRGSKIDKENPNLNTYSESDLSKLGYSLEKIQNFVSLRAGDVILRPDGNLSIFVYTHSEYDTLEAFSNVKLLVPQPESNQLQFYNPTDKFYFKLFQKAIKGKEQYSKYIVNTVLQKSNKYEKDLLKKYLEQNKINTNTKLSVKLAKDLYLEIVRVSNLDNNLDVHGKFWLQETFGNFKEN